MWWNYSLKPATMTLSNNGHTGEANSVHPQNVLVYVTHKAQG
jgi:hypothetical protein